MTEAIFYLFLLIILLVSIGLAVWFSWMVVIVYSGGAPYVGTRRERMKRLMAFADLKSDDVVIDLGSGDGRLVLAAAEAGVRRAIGIERHPGLVLWSRWRAFHQKRNNVEFKRQNLWKADLSQATVIFVYLLPHVMKKLEPKLARELSPNTRIISACFTFPDWKPEKATEDLMMYRLPSSIPPDRVIMET